MGRRERAKNREIEGAQLAEKWEAGCVRSHEREISQIRKKRYRQLSNDLIRAAVQIYEATADPRSKDFLTLLDSLALATINNSALERRLQQLRREREDRENLVPQRVAFELERMRRDGKRPSLKHAARVVTASMETSSFGTFDAACKRVEKCYRAWICHPRNLEDFNDIAESFFASGNSKSANGAEMLLELSERHKFKNRARPIRH